MGTPLPFETLRTGCKINIFLRIAGRRPDGYHELETVFYPLPEPHDELVISPAPPGTGITLICDNKELAGQENTVQTAWRLFAKATGFAPDMQVELRKGIPHGAGLGGGSADAALLLRFLNRHAGRAALDAASLNAVAVRIGADVPFFLNAEPAFATGVGEQLIPCSVDLRGFTLLLACPPIHISTAWAFSAWDKSHATTHGLKRKSTENLLCQLTSFSQPDTRPFSRALWLFNSFESVVYAAFPKLRAYKESLIRHGAATAMMSGSGASLFALYRETEKAMSAQVCLQQQGVPAFIHHL